MSRRFNRPHRDASHGEVEAALHACGICTLDLSMVGGGCPDIAACGGPLGSQVWMVEVKNKGNWRGKRGTPDAHQASWMAAWPGPSVLLRDGPEAAEWAAMMRRTA